jgi:hypothetical protein
MAKVLNRLAQAGAAQLETHTRRGSRKCCGDAVETVHSIAALGFRGSLIPSLLNSLRFVTNE